MLDAAQNTLDGLATGSAYALLALGFTLIFGAMKRLNVAFGPSIMVGVFLGAAVHLQVEAGLLLAAAATVLGSVAASFYVERLCFAAIRRDAALASMVSSFAIWMQLEEGVALLFPQRTYSFPLLTDLPPLEVAGLFMRADHVAMLAVAALTMLALHALLTRTLFGLQLRALADAPEAARVSRVNVGGVALRAFLLAAAVGGIAGFLLASSEGQITPKLGLWATLKGLTAMMLGGLGSIPGAVLGGLLLGIVEAHAQWYLGAAGREIAAYALLFLACVALPAGLLGGRAAAGEAEAARRL